MARQYKKILKKIKPKDKKTVEKPEKVGKDYILIVITAVTATFMLVGWEYFNNLNRALYVALTASLVTTYIRRHAKLTDEQSIWVERASRFSMGAAVILFGVVAYYQYFGE